LAYFTFTGREFDSESGLFHYRARTYSPTHGRFLSRDPLGYVDGLNLYEYVKGKPTKHTDPSGLILEVVPGLVGWAVYSMLNPAERRWCLANPSCCCRAVHAMIKVHKRISQRYNGDPDPDSVGNAVKHCVWMCYTAQLMFCTPQLAKGLGEAHEVGAIPAHARAMDLHNNNVGAFLGGNSFHDCVLKCEQKAKGYSLYWYTLDAKPGLPTNYPGFGIDPNGNVVFGGYGQQSQNPPVLWEVLKPIP
jgi:RHS repeat-associated protein